MPLRPYQATLLADARRAAQRLRAQGVAAPAVLCQLPTGGGKTMVIRAVCEGALSTGGRPMVLVHREELLSQAVEELRAGGLRVGVIASDRDEDTDAPVLVASIPTIIARGELPDGITHLVIDEAHHTAAATWTRAVRSVGPTLRYVVGLSATPARYDGSSLSDVFHALVVGPSIQELQATTPPALCSVRVIRPGERTAALSRDPLDVLLEHRALPSVTFAESVPASRELAARAAEQGLRILHVDGETRGRRELLARLGTDFDGVTNADVLTEGWNWPAAALCVLACPLGSVTRLLQRVGRVMRPAPGKDGAWVYDLMGATHDLGVPGIDDYLWSLGEDSGTVRRASVAVGTCRRCHAAYPYRPECPCCGHRNPPPPRRRVKWGELSEATREQVYARRDPVEWLARTYAHAHVSGWKRGAVERRFMGWAKRWPTTDEIQAARERVSA